MTFHGAVGAGRTRHAPRSRRAQSLTTAANREATPDLLTANRNVSKFDVRLERFLGHGD
jgi:hypothetical protein